MEPSAQQHYGLQARSDAAIFWGTLFGADNFSIYFISISFYHDGDFAEVRVPTRAAWNTISFQRGTTFPAAHEISYIQRARQGRRHFTIDKVDI